MVSSALSDGIFSATAAVIPRPLPKTEPIKSTETDDINSKPKINSEVPTVSIDKISLSLEGLSNEPLIPTERRTLWANLESSEIESELDDERMSPVYEESTNFASTIARLRCLLQQKSTATTPQYELLNYYTFF